MHSTPQLEILADDVKCKHGSTTGQLDANALFYLRSRGIGESGGPRPAHLGFRERPRPEAGDRAAAPVGRPAPAGEPARNRGPRGGAAVSVRPAAGAAAAFDVEAVRREFPVLRETVHGKSLVYLDSAASAQKPQAVIDAESAFYERSYSNIHRGVHHLSMLATTAYEGARAKVQRFLGAAESREIVLLRGTTEAVNLVAQSYGRKNVGAGRRGAHHRPRAPLEHRALAAPVRGEGRLAAGRPDRRRGRGGHGCLRAAALAPHADRLRVPRLERARHDQPRAPHGGARPRRGRGGDGRRGPGGAPPRGGRAGDRLRLLRLLGTQGLRPLGRGRAVRTRRPPRGHAALAGRGRHDRLGHVREVHLERAALQARGGHPEHRRWRSRSARRSTGCRGWAST